MTERQPQSGLINRRDALIWLGKGAFVTGCFAATQVVGTKLQETTKINERLRRQETESARALENGAPLQVKYFAKDLVQTSERLVGDSTDEDKIGMAVGCFAATAIGGYLLRNYPKKINRIIGAGSAVTGKTNDIVSTIAYSKYVTDPRFEEYELGAYFVETNFLSPSNPSTRDVLTLGAATGAVLALQSLVFPSLGRSYLGASPFIAKSNYENVHLVGLSLKLGDHVKHLIQQGNSQDDIMRYLKSIKPSQPSHQKGNRQVMPPHIK